MPRDEIDASTRALLNERVQSFYDRIEHSDDSYDREYYFDLITDLKSALDEYAHALAELAEGYLRERENSGSSFAARAYRRAVILVNVNESKYWGRPPAEGVLDRDRLRDLYAQLLPAMRRQRSWLRRLADGFSQLDLGARPRQRSRPDTRQHIVVEDSSEALEP